MDGASPRPFDVTAVVVTFNSAAVIEDCLAALVGKADIVVVDNASADDTLDRVKAAAPDARIVANGANRGLGHAVNQGFAEAATEFALYLNPDAVLLDDALDRLIAAARADAGTALVAPLLRKPETGELELNVMGPGEIHHVPLGAVPDGPFCTWFVVGAVFLYRMSAWRALGGFDDAIFLFSEDLDLALRTRQADHALVVVPDAVASHLSGRSVPATPEVRAIKDWHMAWSNYHVLAKHGRGAEARAAAWRALRRHGLKTLLYVLLARPKKVRGNYTKAHAAYAFLAGKPATAGPGAADVARAG